MRKMLAVVLVAVVMLVGVVSADEIKVAGGGGPVENILKPVKNAFEKSSGMKLTIIAAGGTNAFKELAKGNIDASTAGFSFEDLDSALKKENFTVNMAEYQSVTIGKGGVFVITHKDNPVVKLTREQAKGLFTGKIQNWKEVGGKDLPVIVVIGKLNPATNNVFKTKMLDNEPYVKDILEATTAEDVKQNITSNPEAVGFGPSTLIDAAVKSPETPEVSRPIILVTKGKPSANVQKLLDFIAGEGQKYIKK
ncbi:MAG: phosphate ABC transporter substrate-binding protein [Thermodesulfovibrio sp.]|nr:phosphate ABC transporter substrate-binding protein [Thermodesulfovibrio sp.]